MSVLARLLFVLLVIVILPTQILGQNPDIEGEWSVTVESPQGPMDMGLTLSVDSQGSLTGKIDGPEGEAEITGETSGNEIFFGLTFNANGLEIDISFEGSWTEMEMEGVVHFGEFGSGDWYASRN